ncbi:MAG: hypothetical protein ACKN82_11715, partial [Pirellula sp.]
PWSDTGSTAYWAGCCGLRLGFAWGWPWGHFVADTTKAKPAMVKIRHDTFIKVANTGNRTAKLPVVHSKVARVTNAQYQMAICWYMANRDSPKGNR